MTIEVRRNAEQSRYEIFDAGELVGIADYMLSGDSVVMPHTEILTRLRGQGYGAQLVRGALDDIRAAGHRVVPQCWYVRQFIDANPEYSSLLAA